MKVVMKDIADALGVSVVSVSKALNDLDGVSDELRSTIKSKAVEMGYRGVVLKNAKPKKLFNIGVVIPQRFISKANNPQDFYLDFFQSICSYNQENKFNTMLYILTEYEEDNLIVPNIISERKVDGVIFLAELKSSYLSYIKELTMPKVFLDFFGKSLDIDCVTTDNYSGSYELTMELINHGHTEIGFVGNIAATTSIQDRFLGFQKALFERQIHFNPNYLVVDRDEHGKFIEVNLPDKLPTGFVANSDRAAYELIKQLKNKGYKVPEDVSVVGFDNDMYSKLSNPQLTTVEVSKQMMVQTACDFIYKKIDNEHLHLGKIMIKGNLISRSSLKDNN
jgi:LacI family transcriptional regulator